jgi:hypothetical protein
MYRKVFNDMIRDFRNFGYLVRSWALESNWLTDKVAAASENEPERDKAQEAYEGGEHNPKKGWAIRLRECNVKLPAGAGGTDTDAVAVKAIVLTQKAFIDILIEADKERQFLLKPEKLYEDMRRVDRVIIIQEPDNNKTMIIRLPTKASIKGADTYFRGNNPYEIPGFYNSLFRAPDNTRNDAMQLLPKTVEGKLDLQAERIGDYTIGNCN